MATIDSLKPSILEMTFSDVVMLIKSIRQSRNTTKAKVKSTNVKSSTTPATKKPKTVKSLLDILTPEQKQALAKKLMGDL
jgi:hypothetical protein